MSYAYFQRVVSFGFVPFGCLYKRGDGSFMQLIEFFTYVWYYKEQHTETSLPISH